jgi:hypothetical protein
MILESSNHLLIDPNANRLHYLWYSMSITNLKLQCAIHFLLGNSFSTNKGQIDCLDTI